MLDLKDAVPVDAFTPMFSEVRERVIATNVDQFLKNCPGKVPSVSLFMWDEMVHRGGHENTLQNCTNHQQ